MCTTWRDKINIQKIKFKKERRTIVYVVFFLYIQGNAIVFFMNKNLISFGILGYMAWNVVLKTAIVGYNLKYRLASINYIEANDNSLFFEAGIKIINTLPFATTVYNADLKVSFNGELLFKIEKQPINRRIYGNSSLIVPIVLRLEKRFFENSFLDFLKSGDYLNWLINIKGTVSLDYLSDFPLNIDLTIDDFLPKIEKK